MRIHSREWAFIYDQKRPRSAIRCLTASRQSQHGFDVRAKCCEISVLLHDFQNIVICSLNSALHMYHMGYEKKAQVFLYKIGPKRARLIHTLFGYWCSKGWSSYDFSVNFQKFAFHFLKWGLHRYHMGYGEIAELLLYKIGPKRARLIDTLFGYWGSNRATIVHFDR